MRVDRSVAACRELALGPRTWGSGRPLLSPGASSPARHCPRGTRPQRLSWPIGSQRAGPTPDGPALPGHLWDPWEARLRARPRLGVPAPASGEAWLGARRSHQKTFVFLQVASVTSRTEDGKGHTRVHTVTRTQSHAHSHTQSHAPSFSQVSNPRASHGFLKGFARLAVRGRRPGLSGSHRPAPFALRVGRRVAPQGAPRAAVGAGSAGTGE